MSPATNVKGKKILAATNEPYTISGSIQPYEGIAISSLPEITKSKQVYGLFTEATLGLYDSDTPTQVYHEDVWLDVIKFAPWPTGLKHNEYYCCKLGGY